MLANLSLRNLPGQFSQLNTAGKIRLAVAGAYASYVGAKVVYYVYKRVTNRQKRLKKRSENAESIEQLSKRLDADPISASLVSHITQLTLDELCKELKEGKIRPIEALKAYQVKALEAHHKTNCLVEVIKEAEELALQLEKGPKDGDLWGVPISIKDDVGIKGYDSAIGMVIKIGKPSDDDSNLVKAFRREGAIPFVKTNVPQTEMSFEPGNPINGVVHNPHKHGHGPGGSSSGEGALIASGGSILGVGSDLGGSIRVPSHFCGVFGFKPTSERVSTRGMSLDYEAVIPIRACWGPISRDVNGLITALRAWWKGGEINKTDPESVPMLFDEKEFTSTRKLRVGYYIDNGIFPTFSACVRAVDMAKDIFRKGGHELVPWSPPHPDRILEIFSRVVNADGGDLMAKELKYDVIHPTIHEMTSGMHTPTWIMKLMSLLIYPVSPETATGIIRSCGSGSVAHNYEMIHEMWQLRRVIQDSWNEAGLDVVICPPQVGAAPPLGSSTYLMRTCIYTATYNLLHFPAGVVPVTKVQQRDLNQLDSDFPPVDQLHRTAKDVMSKTLNLPVGVMVASSRYQDEVCLRAMKILEDGLEHRVELTV